MNEPDKTERNGWAARKPAERSPADGVSDNLDTVYDLLGTAHRRFLLYHLTDLNTEEKTVDAAITGVRAYDLVQREEESLPSRHSVHLELVHNHLPRLEAADVIDYDHQTGVIRYKGNDFLDACLKQARQLELD